MSKICRITIFAFIFGDIPMGYENGYETIDLLNTIDYCRFLISEGYEFEPIDNFNLKDFIDWAEDKIKSHFING